MKSFKEVFKEAMSYKEGKQAAIFIAAGCIAAFLVCILIKSNGAKTGILMGLCLMVSTFSDRLSVLIRVIREQDLTEHGEKIYKDS